MDTVLITLAVAVTLAGPTFLYLCLPHQQLLTQPWPRLPCKLAGWGMMVAAWGLWSSLYQAATGAFITLTFAMIAASMLPFVVAFGRRGGLRWVKALPLPLGLLRQGGRWIGQPKRLGRLFQACERVCVSAWQRIDRRYRGTARWRWALKRSRRQRATLSALLSWPWTTAKELTLRLLRTTQLDQRAAALERRLRLGERPNDPPTPQEQP